MRNMAVAVLRQLGFGGAEVAAVMELTPNYVATLHQRSLREGTAGLVRQAGRPRETGETSWEQARAWRAAGVRDSEIARRLGVNQSTVLAGWAGLTCRSRCRPHRSRNRLTLSRNPRDPGPRSRESQPGRGPRSRAPGRQPPAAACGCLVPVCRGDAAPRVPGPWDPGRVLAAAAGGAGDVALLTAVSMCFALGAATTGQFKHLAAAEAGPLAGLPALPGLRRCARNWQRSRTGTPR